MSQAATLKLRPIGVNDYSVLEGDQWIGRIRYAKERTPGIWLWQIQVNIPGPPFGDAKSIEEAKSRFKDAWIAFKARHTPEQLAKAYEAMNIRDEPEPQRPRRQRFD
jgi:hypothetical protein